MTLELTGTITGNIRKYEAHADSTNDGKTANVEIEVTLDEEQALAFGGKNFAAACFAGFIGKSGSRVFDSVRLGDELAITAEHKLTIDEKPLVAKPKIGDVALGKKERNVTFGIKLQVPGTSKQLRKHLDESAGSDVTLAFAGVEQLDIEEAAATKSRGRKKKGADDDAGNGHDVDEDAAGAEA